MIHSTQSNRLSLYKPCKTLPSLPLYIISLSENTGVLYFFSWVSQYFWQHTYQNNIPYREISVFRVNYKLRDASFSLDARGELIPSWKCKTSTTTIAPIILIVRDKNGRCYLRIIMK